MGTENITFNANHYATIFPSEKGWKRMVKNVMKYYELSEEDATKHIESYKTEEGGYKDQLWCIMSMFGDMYFNGSPYFEKLNMILFNE